MAGVKEPMKVHVALLLLAFFARPVFAEDESRPNEDAMFGGAPAKPSTPAATTPAPAETKLRDAFASGEVTDNPLQIGGIYYQQMIVSGQKDVNVANTPLTAPLQFDGYLDGRPSDRIR